MKGAVKSKGNLGHAILTGAITIVMAFGIVVPTAGILHRAVEYKLSEARFDKRKAPSEPTVTPMETAPVQEEVVPKSELTELTENYQAQISSLEVVAYIDDTKIPDCTYEIRTLSQPEEAVI